MRCMRMVLVRGLLLALAGLIASGSAHAQSGSATLFGTITDQQGAGVPGATITLTQTATSAARTLVTDDGGDYRFVALRPGLYVLKIELSGFRTAVRDKIDLSVG